VSTPTLDEIRAGDDEHLRTCVATDDVCSRCWSIESFWEDCDDAPPTLLALNERHRREIAAQHGNTITVSPCVCEAGR
jgi:hypothetical protein